MNYIHQYWVTSELFGNKIRRFDSKSEANDFVYQKISKMAKSMYNNNNPNNYDYMDIYHHLNSKIIITRRTIMDIRSSSKYPSNKLSNFSPHPFIIDGVQCNSMEGFLQSLKTPNPDMQKYICTLVGRTAKAAGKGKNWQRKQELYWNGKKYARKSKAYQDLITRAYDELSKNAGFQKALLASGNSTITHSIGSNKQSETVLTKQEFCQQLMRIRHKLQQSNQLHDTAQE